MKIGTWNVRTRTLSEAGKIDNIIQEMDRLKVNALGIAESRWPGTGKVVKETGHTFLFSGGDAFHNGEWGRNPA